MFLRSRFAAIVTFLIASGSAQAQVSPSQVPTSQTQTSQTQVAEARASETQVAEIPIPRTTIQQIQFRSLFKLPDPRGEFVRLCAPHMLGRWAHPEAVCGCLHDYAAATVEDNDLREALLRGISETGVPTIETDWVPPSKQSQIGPTFTKIAKPTLQCMFEPSN